VLLLNGVPFNTAKKSLKILKKICRIFWELEKAKLFLKFESFENFIKIFDAPKIQSQQKSKICVASNRRFDRIFEGILG